MDKNQSDHAPAVIIYRLPIGQDGTYKIEVQEVGGLDPLCVPTLLRIAAKMKEQTFSI